MSTLIIPDWLTADFLKSCLEAEEEEPQAITITDHTIESAVPAGNNYSSNMLRVTVNYENLGEDQSISLIIKAPLTTGFMLEFSEFMDDIYYKEPKFYNQFIRETYKLCKHDIVPKSYSSPYPLCVVMEDLKASGYVMADRHELLDFEHCQLYTKASAKLQALSVAVYKKKPEIIESLVKVNPSMTGMMEQTMKSIVGGGLRGMAAYLEDKSDYKEYHVILKEASESDTFLKLLQDIDKSDKPFKALVQADPWCTNMMFKYNSSGEVIRVKLFDYQNLKFTTPISEFLIFLWVSAHPEVRNTHLNDLYKLYCDSLNSSLAELGCSERLTLEDMKSQIISLSPLVLMVVCTMGPFCLADGVGDVMDYCKAGASDKPIQESPTYQLYQGAAFNKYFPQVLDQVAREGVFDYVKSKLKLANGT